MKSKYIGIGIIALLIGVVALSGCTQSQQNVPPNTVVIQNFAFSPNNLTVKAGTTVTWINNDSTAHTVVSDTGAFQSQNLNNGDKFTFNFTKAGTYSYHCSIHPSMTGTIVVQ
jgi:plastocyanin